LCFKRFEEAALDLEDRQIGLTHSLLNLTQLHAGCRDRGLAVERTAGAAAL
jgi:hypothetical protein